LQLPSCRRIRCVAKFKIPENKRICVATSSNKSVYGAASSNPEEVTMIAEVSSQPRSASRGSDRPVCQVCADTMVAAEASAFLSDDVVSHLWSCETCGYGFVTKHSLKQPKARRTFSAA
jgi:hypothetical protein